MAAEFKVTINQNQFNQAFNPPHRQAVKRCSNGFERKTKKIKEKKCNLRNITFSSLSFTKHKRLFRKKHLFFLQLIGG
jgi:hypothetical protein